MRRTQKTRQMARCALMAAVIAVVAPFTLPVGTVPISLASLAVMLAGAVLPPLQAIGAVGTYLFCGLAGLPVFSGAQGGVSVFLGPTGGYLWGYILCAFITAQAFRKRNNSFFLCALGAFAGGIACLLCGAAYYAVLSKVSFAASLGICLIPFLPTEAIKAVLAVFFGRSIRRGLDRQ